MQRKNEPPKLHVLQKYGASLKYKWHIVAYLVVL